VIIDNNNEAKPKGDGTVLIINIAERGDVKKINNE
jgi:hypothetical protein